jgi:hypothetical protein
VLCKLLRLSGIGSSRYLILEIDAGFLTLLQSLPMSLLRAIPVLPAVLVYQCWISSTNISIAESTIELSNNE